MSIFNNNKAGVLVDSLDNSSNNDSENPYSILLHNNSIPWAFSLMLMVRWAIGMVGMVLNGSLVYVTFKTGSLQSACNWLIAFNAACIACSMPFMSIGVLIVFSNIPDLIPIRTCFWLQMPSLICGNMFMSSMLAIGVDRLFSTLFVWHARLIDKKIYLCCILLLCICHSLFFTILCYQGVISNTTNVVPCTSGGDVYQGYIGNTIFRVNFCIVSLCILCYLIIWITIRRNQTKCEKGERQKHGT